MPFICVVDTVFEGMVASWKEEDGKPVVYETREAAEEDAHDVATEDNPDEEPDTVLEVVVTESEIYDPVDGRIYWREM